jgi:hypothetical protein
MKWTFAFILCVCAMFAAPASARVRSIPPGSFIDLGAGRYRSQGIELNVRKIPGRDLPATFVLDLHSAATRPFRVVIDDHWSQSSPPQFAIGQLDKGHGPVVFIQSYSGGAHCCVTFRFVSLTRSGFRLHRSDGWDGDFYGKWPKDIDGDGRADFVRNDNQFLYAFASYADSYSPPVILNLLGNSLDDVSTRPGFRKLFIEDMRRARTECLNTGGRGACAAYVADAARAGRFATAWKEMLASYDRNSDWGLPDNCEQPEWRNGDRCKKGKTRFKGYPDALMHFLKRTGYLPPAK